MNLSVFAFILFSILMVDLLLFWLANFWRFNWLVFALVFSWGVFCLMIWPAFFEMLYREIRLSLPFPAWLVPGGLFAILFIITAFMVKEGGIGIGKGLTRKRSQEKKRKKGGNRKEEPAPPGAVFLTFDDGPHPQYTLQILDVLEKYHAHGTFFVVGKWAEKYPHIVKKIYEKGMTLGVHSYSHYPLAILPFYLLEDEIKDTVEIIKNITGESPRLFRPPWGFYTKEVIDIAKQYGMETILWSRSTIDWRDQDCDKISSRALTGLQEGEIILFHDGCPGGKHRCKTVESLSGIIEEIQKRGFTTGSL